MLRQLILTAMAAVIGIAIPAILDRDHISRSTGTVVATTHTADGMRVLLRLDDGREVVAPSFPRSDAVRDAKLMVIEYRNLLGRSRFQLG